MSEPVSIVVPAYDEEKSIGKVLDDLADVMTEHGISHEIIVVDDGSQDRTPEEVQRRGVKLIQFSPNRGYGAALKRGISEARYELVAIIDGDGTYPAAAMPELVRAMNGCDMVVGARTGKNVSYPVSRRLAKWFLTKLANYLSGAKIPDLNSGLRVMRKTSVADFLRILPGGFSFTMTITLAMLNNDYNVRFIPIDFFGRKGRSKIRPVRDTLNFTLIIVRTVLYFNPLKVFLPLSALIFFLGVVVLLYSLIFTPQVMDVTVILLVTTSIQVGVIGLLAELIGKPR